MDDHAFDFFAQLLKNMMRKFMQLKDMVAAKLVTSVASNISRCVRCCVALSRAIVFAYLSLRLCQLKISTFACFFNYPGLRVFHHALLYLQSSNCITLCSRAPTARLATGETVENVLEENHDTAPIEEWESKFFDECDADADAADGSTALRPEDVLQKNYSVRRYFSLSVCLLPLHHRCCQFAKNACFEVSSGFL
jgi:hypothetical protein